MKCCMVLQLPEALVRDLLVEWLPFKAVVKLDSAMCSKPCRPVFLSTAYDCVSVYTVLLDNIVSNNARWFVTKRVRLTGLSVMRSVFAESDLRSQFLGLQSGMVW